MVPLSCNDETSSSRTSLALETKLLGYAVCPSGMATSNSQLIYVDNSIYHPYIMH